MIILIERRGIMFKKFVLILAVLILWPAAVVQAAEIIVVTDHERNSHRHQRQKLPRGRLRLPGISRRERQSRRGQRNDSLPGQFPRRGSVEDDSQKGRIGPGGSGAGGDGVPGVAHEERQSRQGGNGIMGLQACRRISVKCKWEIPENR